MAGEPHPKPVKRKRKSIRVIDPKATARAVLAQPRCALCPKPSANGHHLLSRGAPHFGDDVQENIVALCGTGTMGCHGAVENEDEWARRSLGAYVVARRPDAVEYLSGKLGPSAAREWLRRRLYVEMDRVVA